VKEKRREKEQVDAIKLMRSSPRPCPRSTKVPVHTPPPYEASKYGRQVADN